MSSLSGNSDCMVMLASFAIVSYRGSYFVFSSRKGFSIRVATSYYDCVFLTKWCRMYLESACRIVKRRVSFVLCHEHDSRCLESASEMPLIAKNTKLKKEGKRKENL
jgi:hypothetical protein